MNSIASPIVPNEEIYESINNFPKVTDAVQPTRLPEPCIETAFFEDSIARESASARSVFFLNNNTENLHVCKVLKDLIHAYEEFLLEQSNIGLDHTQQQEDIELDNSITESPGIKTWNMESHSNVIKVDSTLAIRSSYNEHTVTGSFTMPKVDNHFTLGNTIHDEIKIAMKSLSTRLDNFRASTLQLSDDQDQDQDGSLYLMEKIARTKNKLDSVKKETVGEIKQSNNDTVNVIQDPQIKGRNAEQNNGNYDTDNTHVKRRNDNGGEVNISIADSACESAESLFVWTSNYHQGMTDKSTDSQTLEKKKYTAGLEENLEKKNLYLTSDIIDKNTSDNKLGQNNNESISFDKTVADSTSQNIHNGKKEASLNEDKRDVNKGIILQDVRMEALDLKIKFAPDFESTHVKRVFSDSDNEDNSQIDSSCSSGVSTMSSDTQIASDSNSSAGTGSLQFHVNLQELKTGFVITDVDNNCSNDTGHSKHQTSGGINSYNNSIYLELDFDELFSENEDIVDKSNTSLTSESILPILHEVKDCDSMQAPLTDRKLVDNSTQTNFDTEFTKPECVYVKETEDKVPFNPTLVFSQYQRNVSTCTDKTHPESQTIYALPELPCCLSECNCTSEKENKPSHEDLSTSFDTTDSMEEDNNIKERP